MDKVYAKNSDFVQREIAGEFLLIPIRRNLTDANAIYVLNQTGTEIWKRFDGERSLTNIKEDLLSEFEVAPEKLDQDISQLITDLVSIQAIHEKS